LIGNSVDAKIRGLFTLILQNLSLRFLKKPSVLTLRTEVQTQELQIMKAGCVRMEVFP
jgi:hypothetical protein